MYFFKSNSFRSCRIQARSEEKTVIIVNREVNGCCYAFIIWGNSKEDLCARFINPIYIFNARLATKMGITYPLCHIIDSIRKHKHFRAIFTSRTMTREKPPRDHAPELSSFFILDHRRAAQMNYVCS